MHNTSRFQLSVLLQQTVGVQKVYISHSRGEEKGSFLMVFGTQVTSMSKTLDCVAALKLFKWSEDIQKREKSHKEDNLKNIMYEMEKSVWKYVN